MIQQYVLALFGLFTFTSAGLLILYFEVLYFFGFCEKAHVLPDGYV